MSDLGFLGKSASQVPRPGQRGSARPSDLTMSRSQPAPNPTRNQGNNYGNAGISAVPDFTDHYRQQPPVPTRGGRGGGRGGGMGGMRGGMNAGGMGRGGGVVGGGGGPGSGEMGGGPGGVSRGLSPQQYQQYKEFQEFQQYKNQQGGGGSAVDLDVAAPNLPPPPSTTMGARKGGNRPTFMDTSNDEALSYAETIAHPLSITDDFNTPAVKSPPAVQAPSVPPAVIKRLGQQLESAMSSIKLLTEQLAEVRELTKTFYGCVDGGEENAIVMYSSVPKEGETVEPAAYARKGKWLKLSYPRFQRQQSTSAGVRTDTWLCVHAIDPKTGEFKHYWTKDKTDNGSKAFAVYDLYKGTD
jgi:hypothetical protein